MLLERSNFTQGKIEELLALYNNNNRNYFIEKLRKILRFKEIRETNFAINDLRNHYWLSKLYLSEDVDKDIEVIINKMIILQTKYEILEEMPLEYRHQNDEVDEAQKIKEEIQKLVPQLIILIKKELSVF